MYLVNFKVQMVYREEDGLKGMRNMRCQKRELLCARSRPTSQRWHVRRGRRTRNPFPYADSVGQALSAALANLYRLRDASTETPLEALSTQPRTTRATKPHALRPVPSPTPGSTRVHSLRTRPPYRRRVGPDDLRAGAARPHGQPSTDGNVSGASE